MEKDEQQTNVVVGKASIRQLFFENYQNLADVHFC